MTVVKNLTSLIPPKLLYKTFHNIFIFTFSQKFLITYFILVTVLFKIRLFLQEDYYELLGCDQSADTAQLRIAVRKGQLECHPDKCVHLSLEEQTERRGRFEALTRAWRILEEEESRKIYDAALRQAQLMYSTSAPVQCTLNFSDISNGEEEIDPQEVYTAPCRCGGEYILEGVAALARIPYAHCFQCSLVASVVYPPREENKDPST